MFKFIIGNFMLGDSSVYYSNKEKENDSEMANLHNDFLTFEQNISVSSSRITKLINSRQALERRIVEHFRLKYGVTIPKFYIQGSYKMKTMILDSSSTYDVDLGIYFSEKPSVTSGTLQRWVAEAVEGHTEDGVQHRDKCVRVVYRGDFHIDLPVYYQRNYDRHPYLATKNGGWLESDPKELCDWFVNKKDAKGQLVRLVKYFKAWAKTRSRKMPSGIALTVLATKNYKANDRDDVAFYETAQAILSAMFWGLECINPAAPGDDLLNRLEYSQKRNFHAALKELVQGGKQAIDSYNTFTASNIWRQQLGNKF
jgi:hypothetical protein